MPLYNIFSKNTLKIKTYNNLMWFCFLLNIALYILSFYSLSLLFYLATISNTFLTIKTTIKINPPYSNIVLILAAVNL